MKRLAILFINFYQRFISPVKGFRCAYGALHGRGTCSQIIKNIVREHGVIGGRAKIRQQFASCRAAYATLQEHPEWDQDKKKKKRDCDYCDCPGPCDFSKSCGGKGKDHGGGGDGGGGGGGGGDGGGLDCHSPCDVNLPCDIDLPCDCSP